MSDRTEPLEFSDGDLPDSCFAFVPDDVPSHRKLKLCSPDGKRDAGIIGAAKAALGKGYRGNRVDLPESARAGVIAKVNAAARSVGIDPFTAAEEAFIFDDAPSSSDVHVDAPIGAINAMKNHLKRKLRRKGESLSAADVDEAHRKVRAVLLAPDTTGATATSEESTPFPDEEDEPPVQTGERRFAELPADDLAQFIAELKPFAEPPQWIQYLPPPATYTHGVYGKIALTPGRVANFVTQFNSGVYQKHLPIDAEHQIKLSGAVGYIKEMRLASDGGAEARVEWTDRGEKLLRSDRFKYFSPEWFDEWRDPVDEKVHRDVAIGEALTTRPFFKERALKPLSASEAGAVVWADDEAESTPAAEPTPQRRQGARSMSAKTENQNDDDEDEQDDAAKAKGKAKGMTEDQAREFSELKSAFQAAETARIAAETVAKQANDRVEKLEMAARRKSFSDEVLGKSDASGIRWVGAPEKHVAFLEKLADKFGGEEAPEVREYIETQRANAAALTEAGVYQVYGADAAKGGNTAMEQLQAMAETLAGVKSITKELAFAEVVADPKHKALVRDLYK